ncbi:MAG TPA: FtsX-like permease family protein, partial [Anaerolineales bacterium]|nr:FtsX-like permease family protein [Anaerolineales bacterium]
MRNFSLPLRNLTANPLRSTLTALAITVGVAMVLAASIVGQAANESATLDAPQTEQTLTPFDQPTEVNTQIVQIGLGITGVMLVFAAGFVILNAFAMTVTARQREIGALRALGMTRVQVTRSVLGEAAILALAGVGAGILIGLLLARGVMAAFGTLEDVALRVPWWGLVLAITLGLVITIGAALHPARRASRVPPLSAIRPGAEDVGESKLSRKRGVIGILLLIITLIVLALLGQLLRPTIWPAMMLANLGFILLLAGTVLALPSAVGWVARLAGKWLALRFGVAGRLAADNFRRNPTRSALTVGGMIAGLTTIIIVSGVMTVLIEQGFSSFALMMREDRFVSPNVAAMFEAGEISFENMSAMAFMAAPLDPELVGELEALERDGVIEIERIGAAPIQPELQISPGFPAVFVEPDIYLRIGNFDFFEGDSETALAMMEQGNAVLVMPLIAERFGAGVGDAIPVQTPQGEVMFTIAGIGGNGWNMPAFSLADGARYFDIEPTMLGVIIPAGQDREAVLGEVEKIIDDYPDRMLLSMQDEFLDVFDQVQGRFRTLLNALLSLGVLLAGLGVVNTMVINVAERGREIGMLRAVGATRRQVRQSIVIEAATLGLMAAIISILLSFLMITVFIVVVAPNAPASIGLRIDSDLTSRALSNAGQDMVMASLFSLVFAPFVAALAAYFPARQAAALDVVEATRSERLSLKSTPAARPETHRLPRDILWSLARRNLDGQRTRTVLSAFAVALGSAMIISAGVVSDGVLRGFGTDIAEWLVNGLQIILGVAGVIVLLAAAFLMFNALMMAVTERQAQIGALRSLGATRRQTMGVVMREALLIGIGGSVLGLLIGPLLGGGVLALMQNADINVGRGEITPGILLLAFGVGVGATLLATWIPARRAANISPLVALRPETEGNRDTPSRVSTLVGLFILTGLAVYLAVDPPGRWVESPWEWIMSLGLGLAWFLGVALVLPAAVGWLSTLLRKPVIWLGGTTGRLLADNVARSRRRVSLTVFAFVIGLGMISGQQGIFNFINNVLIVRVFERQIQQAEWQVAAFNLAGGVTTLEDIYNTLSPRVIDAVYETVGDRALIGHAAIINSPEISYYPNFPSMTLDPILLDRPDAVIFTEGDRETMLGIMDSGCGVLIFPGAASNFGYQLGDTVQLTTPNGSLNCVIAGVGTSQSIFSVVGLTPDVRRAYEINTPGELIIVPHLDTDRDALEAGLRETLARFLGEAWLVKPEESLQGIIESRVILDNVVNVTLLMAIVAAALGVINTTAMSVTERRRELGLLRAVGMTRRGVLAVVVGEAAFLGFLGGLLGLALGVGIGMIFGLSYGGNAYGLKLNLWASAWEASAPVIGTAGLGLIAAPFVAAFAAWLPARSLTRGAAIETLTAVAHIKTPRRAVSGWLARGSIRTQFVLGTGVLLFIVLAAIVGFVTNHARIRMTEQ